jgi:hypothetical protein
MAGERVEPGCVLPSAWIKQVSISVLEEAISGICFNACVD